MDQPQAGDLSRALGLSQQQAHAAFHAVREVATADGLVGARSRNLLLVVARALAISPEDAATPVDLATVFSGEEERRILVDTLVIPACIEGEVTTRREDVVLRIASRLGVSSHWALLLPSLRLHRTFAVKRALVSRSPDARRMFRRIWQEEGVPGILRAVLFVLGFQRDPQLAARFHALADCPRGSFGRAVADHFEARSIAFPGEKNGMPERMMHHDLMHVLNGYDTDAAGECELAAFYASVADGDAFTFLMTVLATFHLGLRVSPAVVAPAQGAFDPERVLAAFLRGRSVRVDFMGVWNYWELMPLPLTEARARLGLALDPHVP